MRWVTLWGTDVGAIRAGNASNATGNRNFSSVSAAVETRCGYWGGNNRNEYRAYPSDEGDR
jgi:hypothetical protein